MRNPPVHWYEGVFLCPQHFQAAERNLLELQQTSEKWDHPFNYGLFSIQYSKEALANGQFQVHAIAARMRDGSLVSLDAGQEPDRINLKPGLNGNGHANGNGAGGHANGASNGANGHSDGLDEKTQTATADLSDAFEQQPVIRIYLATPKLKMGRANVAREDASNARFIESQLTLQDESCGGNEREIQVRNLNVRLMLSTDDLAGYDLLPVAQVKRASEGEAVPQIDPGYIPPVISTEAWPGLGRDMVRAIYDVIGQKIDVLSQQVINRGIGFGSTDAGDLERLMMLTQLNASYGALSVLAFASCVHPFTAYYELCRVAGQLAVFSRERRPAQMPAYDHDDLYTIFHTVKEAITGYINAVRDYEFEQRWFAGSGMGMQVTLEPKWLHHGWQWYVGVNKGDLTHQQCSELLSAGELDWKFGSSRQVEILFQQRAQGLQLVPVDHAIRALPARKDWLYYEISRDDSAAWRDVQQTQTLALRLRDSLIVNREQLAGKRQIVVTRRGKSVPLEFALFAVPAEL